MRALVTGGSGAIGSAICLSLATPGRTIAVGYRTRPHAAADVVAGVTRRGGYAFPLGFDVSDPGAAETAVREAADRMEGLDVVVHAAAQNVDGLLADLKPGEIERLLAVNVAGAMSVTRAALPWLLRSGRGRIVHLSSVLASRSVPGSSIYAATKGAIEAMTRALAVELGPKRITVNAVAPGFVDAGLGREPVRAAGAALTRLVPARRPGSVAEIAAAAAFLASESAAYVNGIVMPVDGGLLAGARLQAERPVEIPSDGATARTISGRAHAAD